MTSGRLNQLATELSVLMNAACTQLTPQDLRTFLDSFVCNGIRLFWSHEHLVNAHLAIKNANDIHDDKTLYAMNRAVTSDSLGKLTRFAIGQADASALTLDQVRAYNESMEVKLAPPPLPSNVLPFRKKHTKKT